MKIPTGRLVGTTGKFKRKRTPEERYWQRRKDRAWTRFVTVCIFVVVVPVSFGLFRILFWVFDVR